MKNADQSSIGLKHTESRKVLTSQPDACWLWIGNLRPDERLEKSEYWSATSFTAALTGCKASCREHTTAMHTHHFANANGLQGSILTDKRGETLHAC